MAPPKIGIRSLLAGTETTLRPAGREDLVDLVTELNVRGMTEAARRLREQLSTADADFERLLGKLIANRAAGAAQAVLTDWQRRAPRQATRQRFWSAAIHFAGGEFELASRDLARLEEKDVPDLAAAVRAMRDVSDAERQGRRVGVERNPWQASFVDEAGKYVPGQIASAELKKLDKNAADSLASLLQIVPMQGNLWGLMGELLNAAGDIPGALASFKRAEALAYTPRLMLEHRKVLEDHVKKLEAQASGKGAVSGAPASPATSNQNSVESGLPRPVVWAIVGVGAFAVAALGYLQIREWLRRAKQ